MLFRFHVLALVVLSLGVSACQQSFREPVTTRKLGGNGPKLTKVSQVCRGKSGRVDEEMKPSGADGKVPTVFACVSSPAEEESTTPQDEARLRPEELQPRYWITNDKLGLMVSLRLGVEYPEGTEKVVRDASMRMLRLCVRKFQDVWVRSKIDAGIKILINETQSSLSEGEEDEEGTKRLAERTPDQILTFIPAANSNSDPVYVLSLHRNGATHWPLGSREKASECAKKFPNDKVRRMKCESKIKEELNQEFCVQLSRQLAVWLGLSDPRAVADKCNDSDFPVNSKDQGFHASTLKASNAKEFWEKARFSKSDLKTILAPVCQIP